jgi:hypothetical protein
MDREYRLVVNGRRHTLLSGDTMVPYEDIVLIAYGKLHRLDYTVTWYYPKENRGGTLTAGESVRLRDGLTFNVSDTSRA